MPILDRWIAARFLANFAFVFSVMFLFGVSIDTILVLDKYIDAAEAAVAAGRFGGMWIAVPAAVVDYHAPRVFQFYSLMTGLCAVAAAGFTFAQMVRARELVAVLAAGVSLWRVAMTIAGAAVILNLLQLVNGEVILPRLAPLLARDHEAILESAAQRFPVRLTEDGSRRLICAERFEPATNELVNLIVIERDEKGAATRRIEAERGQWSEERGGWILERGLAAGRSRPGSGDGREARIDRVEAVDFAETDLSPKALLVRRVRGFAQLLSARQINDLAAEGGIDSADATRLVGQRFAGVCVNLLMLAITLPFFLAREPKKMLRPSVLCAATAVPGLIGSLFLMTVPIPGIPPAVGVFLPVAMLLPIAAWRIGALRT
ncbi:MAG: LptF/LptG family permease [Planctomycetota bacterium]